MPRNAYRKGTRASTSFSKEEVEVTTNVFFAVLRGGDARTILSGPLGRKVMAKFQRLKKSIEEKRAGV